MTTKELIIDTGFFIALLSKKDQFHQKAVRLRTQIDDRKWITTWPVFTEVCHILTVRGVDRAIIQLLHMYESGGFDLFPLSKIHIPKMITDVEKYHSLPMDLADASLVILAEELGHGDIVSTDVRDFATYRWKNRKPFNNLFKTIVIVATPLIKAPLLSGTRVLDTWYGCKAEHKVQRDKRSKKVLELVQQLKPSFHRADLEKLTTLRAQLISPRDTELLDEINTCLAAIDTYPSVGLVRDLPAEKWLELFSFVTARKDYFTLMRISRQWSAFAKDPSLLANMLGRGCFGRIPIIPLQNLLQNCGTKMRHLDLANLLTEKDEKLLTKDKLGTLLRSCPSLTRLTLFNLVSDAKPRKTVDMASDEIHPKTIGTSTTRADPLCHILVETGIANSVTALYLNKQILNIDPEAVLALTATCPKLLCANVHYRGFEGYKGNAHSVSTFEPLVRKGVKLARCYAMTETEKTIYGAHVGGMHFLLSLDFDFEYLLKREDLLAAFDHFLPRTSLRKFVEAGMKTSLIHTFSLEHLKILTASAQAASLLVEIDLSGLDISKFQSIVANISSIRSLMSSGMDFDDFKQLPVEQQREVLINLQDFKALLEARVDLATLFQAPKEKRELLVKKANAVSRLLDKGQPLDAILQLDFDTFSQVLSVETSMNSSQVSLDILQGYEAGE